jgi:hypothetical protein
VASGREAADENVRRVDAACDARNILEGVFTEPATPDISLNSQGLTSARLPKAVLFNLGHAYPLEGEKHLTEYVNWKSIYIYIYIYIFNMLGVHPACVLKMLVIL